MLPTKTTGNAPTGESSPRDIGDRAETLAAKFLQAQGLKLIERNYTRRIGEIDLIVQDPATETIIFVEVRYRQRASRFGDGIDSITMAKQRKLRRTARAWLQQHATPATSARIDVLAIQSDSRPESQPANPLDGRSEKMNAGPVPSGMENPLCNASVRFDEHRVTWITNAI